MWEGVNQRRFPRASYKCVVTLKAAGNHPSVSVKTENIGLGGICVLLDRGVDVFSPVRIKIALEDGKPPLVLEGTIVWVVRRRDFKKDSCFDTGIEFANISPEQKARLEAVIDKVS